MIYDPNTFSNINEVKTTHLDLNFIVDFERKILDAVVTLKLVTLVDNVNEIILDTRYLNIKSVSCCGAQLKHNLADLNESFGSALHIQLNDKLSVNTEFDLVINYCTSEQGTAVQWLEPIQTSGKKHPYLFTQCQAIHARSLVPCQDTPAFKLSYHASVQVPQPLRALMSAVEVGEENVDNNTKIYKFEQTVKIPSYLIALAVGNLVGKKIGPRSTVWTEPEVVDSAAWEFVDTEKFIEIGEKLLTPYEWKKYDLLVLPASFPYGGMENPCLTFVTPTLLAGDRSLVDVVAHEISHSWMGNLVTTLNWEHFWLNEGWTVFIERKIMGRLHGEAAAEFDAIIGWRALEQDIKLFGENNVLTALTPKLKDVDPDDSFSSVPYEKGFNFLYHIQKVIGGSQNFEPYMKAHVQEFAGKSITTDDWKRFLYSFVEKNCPEKKTDLDNIQWDAWLHSPGMPPVKNEFDHTLAKACHELAERWNRARDNQVFDEFSPDDIKNFTPGQKMVFLERLFEFSPLPFPVIEALNKFYSFMDVRNSEIRFRWQLVCLKSEYEPIFPYVVKFVTEQGRMKYVRPLYRLLNQTKNGSELAKKTFRENRSFYHPIAAAMIEKDILK
ncbi:leukotriene A4 hydrolase [Gigaspora rosea]|uniref:Leukotriene A(4) hydrolase n=1 Tax=Gigaspora rosea TaxID=44941 RepID=A0A397VCQ1_9GLOM|nr:leukotriene A4 hydrolase [Gigaspora rosea]